MYYVFILFLLVPAFSHASRINKFENSKYHIKLGLEAPGFDVRFHSRNSSSSDVKIAPNLNTLLSVGFSMTGVGGLSWWFETSQSDEDIRKRGRTNLDDYRFNFVYDRFLVAINYSNYKGLYLESSPSPHVLYPNMKLSNLGINFIYALNPERFSLPAMLDQNQRQEVSGGSWILASSYEELSMDNNGDLILPVNGSSPFKKDQSMTGTKFKTLNFYGGGGYSFVFRQAWFISGYALLGMGIQRSNVKASGGDYKQWEVSHKGVVSIATGYNGLKYFSGLNIYANGTTNRTDDTSITNSLYSSIFYVGVHL